MAHLSAQQAVSSPGRTPAGPGVLTVLKQALTLTWRSYADWMAGMLIAIVLRLIALCPLLALAFAAPGSPLRYAALLSPGLYVFLILPLRYSLGEAMAHALSGGSFATGRLLSLRGYGEKLKAALAQGLRLLPWGLPFLVGAGIGLFYWHGNGIVFLQALQRMGRLLGPEAGFVEGIFIIALLGGLLLLVLLLGMMRQGMLRFVWASCGGKYRRAREEMQKRLAGRRLGQFGIGLLQGILALPVALPGAYLGYRLLRLYLLSPKEVGAFLAQPLVLWGAVAALFLLYYPLLPLRRVLSALFVAGEQR